MLSCIRSLWLRQWHIMLGLIRKFSGFIKALLSCTIEKGGGERILYSFYNVTKTKDIKRIIQNSTCSLIVH